MCCGLMVVFHSTSFYNKTQALYYVLGQLIRSIGLIPVTFMMSGFLGDAPDDVKKKSNNRNGKEYSGIFA